MKKKLSSALLCVCLIVSVSFAANAVWTSSYKASYKKGNNYSEFTGIPNSQKRSNAYLNNAIEPRDKTSWTTPRLGIVDTSKTGMTTINSYYTGTIVLASYATAGGYYNVVINGSANQLGTDTMSVRYNLDYS